MTSPSTFQEDDLTSMRTEPAFWLGLTFFAGLVVWANVGMLDVFGSAPGQIVPASGIKAVQHLEGGIVSDILVVEGQNVAAGEALIVLEPTRSQAEVDELALRIAALKTDMIRLNAEAALETSLVFGNEFEARHPHLVRNSRELFEIRTRKFLADVAVLEVMVEQRHHAMNETAARLKKDQAILDVITEQVQISSDLLAQKLSNRMKHLLLLREEAELRGGIGIHQAALDKQKASVAEAQTQLAAMRAAFVERARTERDSISRSLSELSERLVKFKDSLSRTVLRSPVDGVIKSIHPAAQGEVVKPGATVLDIVPSGDDLIVEARMATQDIGFVQIGNPVQLQLASPDAQMFEKLAGEVTHISADTLMSEDGSVFYQIRIKTDADWFTSGSQRYHLYPGMQVQSFIRTGERSIMEYILSPLLKTAGDALHER